MTRKNIFKILTSISVALSTLLAWLSGFIVMQIVYDSIVAAIVFGTIWAIIVFCESRFSYISLKSDGRITITKEEVKSNLWQIIASALIAILVAIPLELKIYAKELNAAIGNSGNDLGLQIRGLWGMIPSHWAPIILIAILIIVIFQIPIIIKMASEE